MKILRAKSRKTITFILLTLVCGISSSCSIQEIVADRFSKELANQVLKSKKPIIQQELAEKIVESINYFQAVHYRDNRKFSATILKDRKFPSHKSSMQIEDSEFTYRVDIHLRSAFHYGESDEPHYKNIVGAVFVVQHERGESTFLIICRSKQAGSRSISPPIDFKTCGQGTERI